MTAAPRRGKPIKQPREPSISRCVGGQWPVLRSGHLIALQPDRYQRLSTATREGERDMTAANEGVSSVPFSQSCRIADAVR